MAGNALLVPPRSAFGSREELCAFVSYKMRRATELFTFKCSLYQRELKLYLPEPVPKHRRWIDTFDSESIVTIPISKIEKDEIELFRKYFPDDMDLDSIFPGDLLQRSFKKRISILLTSLVNKIVFLLVLRHDTWYVHQEARDGLREYLVEKIWPRQPKLRLLYRDHVTTFVDTRIRHFRDSVGRYFRDLHANSKNGEVIANLIVTCDYKQSELDDMIKKALEEQKTMFENEKKMEYIESPNRNNYEKSNTKSSLFSSQTEKVQNKTQKYCKNDRSSNSHNTSSFKVELEENHEDFYIEDDLEYHEQDLEKELESYHGLEHQVEQELEQEVEQNPDHDIDDQNIDQDREQRLRKQRLKLRMKQKLIQKQRLKLKLNNEQEQEQEQGPEKEQEQKRECEREHVNERELEIECDNLKGLDEEKKEGLLEDQATYNSEFEMNEKLIKGCDEKQKSKRTLFLTKRFEQESELEKSSNSSFNDEKNAIYPPLKKKNKSDNNLIYPSLNNMGISNSNSSPPVVSIPSIPSIQSISSNFTSTMSSSSSSLLSPSSSLPSDLVSRLNIIPNIGGYPGQIQINSPIDKSSIYASFLNPHSNSVFTKETSTNQENLSNSNSSLESNSSSNIVYRNIQTDINNVSSTSSLSNFSISNYSPKSKSYSSPDILNGSIIGGSMLNHYSNPISDSGLTVSQSPGLGYGIGSGLGPGPGARLGLGLGSGSDLVLREKKISVLNPYPGSVLDLGPVASSGSNSGSEVGAEIGLDSDSKSNPVSVGFHGYHLTPMMNYPYFFGSIKDSNLVFGNPFIFSQLNSGLQPACNIQAPPAYFLVPNYSYGFQSLYPTQSGLSQLNPYWFSSSDINHFCPINMSKISTQSEIDQINPNGTIQAYNS
ncbi:uncharacterized protein cubi_01561 [Cryptosporidium ubiquitum]|uniref:Uncharacterized protein n=1 Tax=Cryptosporidium ubiquitum TaxID=857276 RepID=A0A1J4MGS8_9CRYT|nr:uncharacterized protein cubi_01561 [Cryptosporidium ubiquitum]OII72228.1 hypothetical protein cubi_01561 [Cryptosporidium ubiquitum]